MNLKNLRLCILSLCVSIAAGALALSPSFYAPRSVLSSGRWVKIRVPAEGLYRIPYDSLAAWGFADPSRVSVYGYGGAMLTPQRHSESGPDDLTRSYTHHAGGQIFFYGEGPSRTSALGREAYSYMRNPYSSYGYYFLSDCGAGDVPSLAPSAASVFTTTSYSAFTVDNDVDNPVGCGVAFFDRPLRAGGKYSYVLPVRGFDPSELGNSVYVAYNFVAANTTRLGLDVTPPAEMNILLRNVNAQVAMMSNTEGSQKYLVAPEGSRTVAAPDGAIPDGDYVWEFACPSGASPAYCALDRVHFVYPRVNRLDGAPLVMERIVTDGSTGFSVSGASASSIVLNCTDPSAVALHPVSFDPEASVLTGCYGMSPSDTVPVRLMSFDTADADAFPLPGFDGEVAPQDIHGSDVPQMLIVTTRSLRPAADELAAIHSARGLECLVVTQDEVFNEFSSGTPMPFAINRCAKMFYDRDPQRFRYVLLYGRSTWDPRGVTRPADDDYVITHECEFTAYNSSARPGRAFAADKTTAFVSDSYMGILGDSFDVARIDAAPRTVAVGRIPARSVSEARDFNAKIKAYLDNPATIDEFVRTLAMSDLGNRQTHLNYSLDAIGGMRRAMPAMTFIQGHNELYSLSHNLSLRCREVAASALKSGVGLLDYSGHGSGAGIGTGWVWLNSNVRNVSYSRPPLAILITCDTYIYDIVNEGFVHNLLSVPDGGAMGAIASARAVYMDLNQPFHLALTGAYAGARAGMSMGEVLVEGYNSMISGMGVSRATAVNAMCFNYCGDPSLPLAAPSHDIAIESIGGSDLRDLGADAPGPDIVALRPSLAEGRVTDSRGRTDESFSGTATLYVYESERRAALNNPSDSVSSVSLDEDLLASFPGTVRNGRFSIPFTCPAPSYPGKANRVVVTATAGDGDMRAAGVFGRCRVTDPDGNGAVSYPAPEICDLSISSPGCASGGPVGPSATVSAVVSVSELGLYIADAMGRRPSLRIDSRRVLPVGRNFIRPAAGRPGVYLVEVPVDGLADGQHTLTLSVADNAGQVAEASIAFAVSASSRRAVLSLAESNAADARSSLTLELDSPVQPSSGSRLIITDALGNTVLSVAAPAFPYVWNLMDSDGHPVPDGHYGARFISVDRENGGGIYSPLLPLSVVR